MVRTISTEAASLRDVFLCLPDHAGRPRTHAVARATLAAGRPIDCAALNADLEVVPGGPVLTPPDMQPRLGAMAALDSCDRPLWQAATAGMIEGGDVHLICPVLAATGTSVGRTPQAVAGQHAG